MRKYIGMNGGSATAIKGAGLAHRRLSALQRACLVVEILAGHLPYKASRKSVTAAVGASSTFVGKAAKLPHEERVRILAGKKDSAAFRALLKPAVKLLPPPTKIVERSLARAICEVGIDRTLEIAAAVDQAFKIAASFDAEHHRIAAE